jgi:CHASE2 domain-containing sensor protein
MNGRKQAKTAQYGRIRAAEWWFFLFLWLVSFAVGLVDLFGVGRASNTISQEVFYEVASPSILDMPPPPITVVLANDADLEALTVTWPLDHAVQAEIISEILVRRPRALFIDFLFLDGRPAGRTGQNWRTRGA